MDERHNLGMVIGDDSSVRHIRCVHTLGIDNIVYEIEIETNKKTTMKYPQNEEQSMQAIKEYEEFIAANGKYDVRINLDDERDSELIVSQVDACFYRGKILGDKVMFTEMQFTEGEEYEDAELHINKVEIPFALLEKVMNVINTYRQ